MKRKRISMERISGIYEIKNIINNKRYIGSSVNIYERWRRHILDLEKNVHHSIYLQRAWNKDGCENFKFNIIEKCSSDILLEREQYWYDYYESGNSDFGYNMSEIARTPKKYMDIEDLKDGKCAITYEQFINIIDLLINTDMPMIKMEEELGVNHRTINEIYNKNQYSQLTQNYIFQKRESKSTILSKEQVLIIINRLRNNEFSCDIANDFNVSTTTIDDIRYHRTWKEFTDNIIFDNISNRKQRTTNAKKIYQYDLDGNLVKIWDNARQIDAELGISYKQISAACHGTKRIVYGYVWRFENDSFDKYPVDTQKYMKKKIA